MRRPDWLWLCSLCASAQIHFPKHIRQYIQQPVPQASFFGHEYLSYDFSETRNGVNSREEELSIMFKTSRPDAMLFYAGDIQDYIHVALKDGAAVATSNLGSGPRNITIDPFHSHGTLKFNDNHWHHLILHRRLTTMSLRVDGQHAEVTQTEGHMEWLSHVVAYVAAHPHNKALPRRLLTKPFVGCMTKVRYRADSRYIDFLEMARLTAANPAESPGIVRMAGNVSFNCRDESAPRPVSFLNDEAFLRLPSWQTGVSGTLAFKFRSNEPDGLLLFDSGVPATTANASADFIAFELVDGFLFFAMNLGSGTIRLQASSARLSDKTEWHSVTLVREATAGSLIVDNLKTEFATPGKAKALDLGAGLLLGGASWAEFFSSSVWTASLRRGFRGCIRDLTLNGIAVDLVGYLHQPSARSDVEGGCAITVDLCPASPCLNGGRCSEGWRRFRCDCAKTAKTGPTCSRDPLRVSFEKEDQMLRVSLSQPLRSQAEDVELKFQTQRSAGYLIGASSSAGFDRLDVSLYDGQVFLELQISSFRLKPVSLPVQVDDGRWHTLRIARRGDKLRASLDGADPDVFEIEDAPTWALSYDTFWAGHSEAPDALRRQPFDPADVVPKKGFLGQMAGFVFNRREVFTMAADLQQGIPFYTPSNASTRIRIPEWSKPPERVVSFTRRTGFAELSEAVVEGSSLLHAFFQFRTLESSGLLLYAAGLSRDYFAVELVDGRLRYSFNSGDGPQALLSRHDRLDDFDWHRVQIYQATAAEHFLVVDNATTKLQATGSNTQLNLRGSLFVGGLGGQSYAALPPSVLARHGYRGCLASLALSHTPVDLGETALRLEAVAEGCRGPDVQCSPNSCEAGGVCRQHWASTSCDCSLTTRGGQRCEDPGTAFAFGPNAGAILWTWPEGARPSTGQDSLALGLKTTSREDAVVFRVDSQNPKDFLQLEITGGGFASVAYNLGGSSYRVGDMMRRVNDGRYHVVRFARNAANATFQLDNHSKQFKNPKGQQLQTLNQQARISVGARLETRRDEKRSRRASTPRILRPFKGTVRGLFFNDLYLLDRAAAGDRRVQLIGGVQKLREKAEAWRGNRVLPNEAIEPELDGALTSRMMSSSSSVGPTDDIITAGSGDGSGCQSDEQMDDDDCVYEADPRSDG